MASYVFQTPRVPGAPWQGGGESEPSSGPLAVKLEPPGLSRTIVQPRRGGIAPTTQRSRPFECGASPWDYQNFVNQQEAVTRPGGALANPTILRMRRELNIADAANSRYYGTHDFGFRPPIRPAYDESPIAARNVSGAGYAAAPGFYQMKPGSTTLPGITGNGGYYRRMDIDQDPRNTIREVRTSVSEDNTDYQTEAANRMAGREGGWRAGPIPVPDALDPITQRPRSPPIDHILAASEILRAQNSTYIVPQWGPVTMAPSHQQLR